MLARALSPTVRAFHQEDVNAILNRDGKQSSPQTILDQAAGGPAFTAVLDDRPIGCAGMVLPWPGLGMAWMVLADDIGHHGLWLTRTVSGFIGRIIIEHDLHRVEAVAVQDSLRNQHWLEVLGFRKEEDGIARAFLSDRRSVVRYELVREESQWPE